MEEEKKEKLERKQGIKYFECEHIKKGGFPDYSYLWMGDKTRAALCPLCTKMEFGNAMLTYLWLAGVSRRKQRDFWEKIVDSGLKIIKDRLDYLKNELHKTTDE